MREFSRIGERVPADFALELSVCQSWILASHLAETGWQRGAKSSYPRAVLCSVHQSCPALCNFMNCSPSGSSVHGDLPGKNTGVGCHALLQGIFPTQGLNPDLTHCRWILYCLSHQRSPRIPQWVAYPFSKGSSWPRNQTRVSCITGGFFTSLTIREAHRRQRKYK